MQRRVSSAIARRLFILPSLAPKNTIFSCSKESPNSITNLNPNPNTISHSNPNSVTVSIRNPEPDPNFITNPKPNLIPKPKLDTKGADSVSQTVEKNIWAVERLGKGKRVSDHDRQKDRIPGYIYGHDDADAPHILIVLDKYQIHSLWSNLGEDNFLLHVFNLNVYDGYGSNRLLYTQPVLPRRVNFSTQGFICNVGFLKAPPGVKLRLDSPIRYFGLENCIGIKKGGQLHQQLSYITFFCLPSELPPRIDVNVENLDIGDTISVGDLGVEAPLHANLDPSSIVCNVV